MASERRDRRQRVAPVGSGAMSEHPDGHRSRLRALIAQLDVAVAASGNPAVQDTWPRLVAELDLGPEPEVRVCPTCGQTGMRAATRCGHCWTPLAPLDHA